MVACDSPDTPQLHQQCVLLHGDVGVGLCEGGERGVDAPQVARLQPHAAQQVSPLHIHSARPPRSVQPQHLERQPPNSAPTLCMNKLFIVLRVLWHRLESSSLHRRQPCRWRRRPACAPQEAPPTDPGMTRHHSPSRWPESGSACSAISPDALLPPPCTPVAAPTSPTCS